MFTSHSNVLLKVEPMSISVEQYVFVNKKTGEVEDQVRLFIDDGGFYLNVDLTQEEVNAMINKLFTFKERCKDEKSKIENEK
jgi:hypothetical protein